MLPWRRAFLYLCIHGALDGWLRIKWLADIRALLDKFSPTELDSTMQEAAEHGILPEVSAAVLLCEQKLGFNRRPVGCLDPGDPAVARIVRFANRLMASNDFCPVRELVPTTAWFINEFSLRSSLKYRVQMIGRSIFRPRVWERVSLPDWLFPLYALLESYRMDRISYPAGKGESFRSPERVCEHHEQAGPGCALFWSGSRRCCAIARGGVVAHLFSHCSPLHRLSAARCLDGASLLRPRPSAGRGKASRHPPG